MFEEIMNKSGDKSSELKKALENLKPIEDQLEAIINGIAGLADEEDNVGEIINKLQIGASEDADAAADADEPPVEGNPTITGVKSEGTTVTLTLNKSVGNTFKVKIQRADSEEESQEYELTKSPQEGNTYTISSLEKGKYKIFPNKKAYNIEGDREFTIPGAGDAAESPVEGIIVNSITLIKQGGNARGEGVSEGANENKYKLQIESAPQPESGFNPEQMPETITITITITDAGEEQKIKLNKVPGEGENIYSINEMSDLTEEEPKTITKIQADGLTFNVSADTKLIIKSGDATESPAEGIIVNSITLIKQGGDAGGEGVSEGANENKYKLQIEPAPESGLNPEEMLQTITITTDDEEIKLSKDQSQTENIYLTSEPLNATGNTPKVIKSITTVPENRMTITKEKPATLIIQGLDDE